MLPSGPLLIAGTPKPSDASTLHKMCPNRSQLGPPFEMADVLAVGTLVRAMARQACGGADARKGGLLHMASLLTVTSLLRTRVTLSLPGTLNTPPRGEVLLRAKRKSELLPENGRLLTFRISKAASASHLLSILDVAVDQWGFNEFHAGAAFSRLARLRKLQRLPSEHLNSHVFRRLQARVLDMISQSVLEARGAANILWAVAVLAVEEGSSGGGGSGGSRLLPYLVPRLVKLVDDTSPRMKPQELANCIWAVARLTDYFEVQEALPGILKSLPSKVPYMKPQEVSNCLWASARLTTTTQVLEILEVVPSIAEQAVRQADIMGPQDLSNCLWAAAQLRQLRGASEEGVLGRLVPRLAAQEPRVVEHMIPQHLANCLWASVYLQDVSEILQMVSDLVRHIPAKAPLMKSQELANCLWAAANLEDKVLDVRSIVPHLAESVAQEAASDNMLPQHLSNCLWASAHLHSSVREVLNALPSILRKMPSQLGGMNSQEVANCLWAVAHLREEVPVQHMVTLLPCLAKRLAETVEGMKPQELSSCLLASSHLESVSPEVLSSMPLLADRSNRIWPGGLKDGVAALTPLTPLTARACKQRKSSRRSNPSRFCSAAHEPRNLPKARQFSFSFVPGKMR